MLLSMMLEAKSRFIRTMPEIKYRMNKLPCGELLREKNMPAAVIAE